MPIGKTGQQTLPYIILWTKLRSAADSKEYTMGAFLDIEEAMVKYSVPAALIDWTQDMLSNRTLTVSNGDSI